MQPLYFVECRFRFDSRKVEAFIECDRDRSSFDQVVSDIASGQIENPIKVIEVFEDEGTSRDVTGDVAQAVFDKLWADKSDCGYDLGNFIDEHCGVYSRDRLNVRAGNLEDVYA